MKCSKLFYFILIISIFIIGCTPDSPPPTTNDIYSDIDFPNSNDPPTDEPSPDNPPTNDPPPPDNPPPTGDDPPPTNNPPARGAILSWVAPTTRTDNNSLSMSEIAGYKIYTGMGPFNLSFFIFIDDAYIMNYTFTDLEYGTHYFAVSTIDISSTESGLSTIVSKEIVP